MLQGVMGTPGCPIGGRKRDSMAPLISPASRTLGGCCSAISWIKPRKQLQFITSPAVDDTRMGASEYRPGLDGVGRG